MPCRPYGEHWAWGLLESWAHGEGLLWEKPLPHLARTFPLGSGRLVNERTGQPGTLEELGSGRVGGPCQGTLRRQGQERGQVPGAGGGRGLSLDMWIWVFACACFPGVVEASLVAVISNNHPFFFFLIVFDTKIQQSDILVLRVSWCRQAGARPLKRGSGYWAPLAPGAAGLGREQVPAGGSHLTPWGPGSGGAGPLR